MPDATSTTCPVLIPTAYGEPAFPKAMLDIGQEGWVILEFDVAADGTSRNVHIWASSLPGGKFEIEVLRAFDRTRFPVNRPIAGCRLNFVFKVGR